MMTAQPAVPDDLMNAEETAKLLHMSVNALYVMRGRAARGEGPPAPTAYRVGRRLLFSRSETLAWLRTRADNGQPYKFRQRRSAKRTTPEPVPPRRLRRG
jgi:hypothetical protein